MKCNTVHTKLAGYLDDAVTGAALVEERVLIREHLEACDYCREELQRYRKLSMLLSRVPRNLPPADLAVRIRVAAAQAVPTQDLRSRMRRMRDRAELFRALRYGADRGQRAAILDLPNARRNQIGLHRFLVNSLQERGHFGFVRLDNSLQNLPRIFVARLHAFQIEHGEAAQLAHGHSEANIDHSIHRAGQDRDFEFEGRGIFPRQSKRRLDLVRIDRDTAGHKRDLIEAVGHACLAIATDPHSHD